MYCAQSISDFTKWTVSKIKAGKQMIAVPEKERHEIVKQVSLKGVRTS